MRLITLFFAGVLFSLGLIISGMVNPAKVLGFLDITGQWDASLAFVMAGAVIVNFFGFRLITKREKPLFDDAFSIPTSSHIDLRLILGAILFGVGWGVVGLCPGPALVALTMAPSASILFVLCMLIGMFLARVVANRMSPK